MLRALLQSQTCRTFRVSFQALKLQSRRAFHIPSSSPSGNTTPAPNIGHSLSNAETISQISSTTDSARVYELAFGATNPTFQVFCAALKALNIIAGRHKM